MEQKMTLKIFIQNALKGMAMGAANVVPGVSGGTIALITGVFERLINAIKSFDLKAVQLLLKGKLKEFAAHIDLWFLISLFTGVGISLLSLAKLFKFLFKEYTVYIWAFFFGLVLASVYFVGKTVKKWNVGSITSSIIGCIIAISFTALTPASQSDATIYLLICGLIAACSMIIPGLSGSFVLILLGNYQLVMVNAISDINTQILSPVIIGAGIGLIGFSHFLSWILKNYHNQTIGLLTGFILGSLGILWPWNEKIMEKFGDKEKLIGVKFHLPEINNEFFVALFFIILGIAAIWITETLGSKKSES